MKRNFNLNLPYELFNRIELMAKYYGKSITEIIVELLEIGYIKFYEKGDGINEFNNK